MRWNQAATDDDTKPHKVSSNCRCLTCDRAREAHRRVIHEAKARGVCSRCALEQHFECTDYGCECCGGGK